MAFTGCSKCGKYPTGKIHYDGRRWKKRFEEPIMCKLCEKEQTKFAARSHCLNDENMVCLIFGFVSKICPKTMLSTVPHVCKWWEYICKTMIDVDISLKWSLYKPIGTLSNWNCIRDENFSSIIDNFRGIRSADLRDCKYLTETSLVKLTYSLTEFCISNNPYLSDEILNAILRTSPLLKNLYLDNCDRLTDKSIIQISNCKHLNHIALIGFPNIKNETFVHILDSCRLLKSIKFEKCKNLSLLKLPEAEFSNLTYLSLSYSRRMDGAGFEKMLSLSPNLSFLNIYNCNINNEELKIVGKYCLDIEMLFAQYNYAICDRDINNLTRCKKLKLLDVSQTGCTREGVDALKKSISGLYIIYNK